MSSSKQCKTFPVQLYATANDLISSAQRVIHPISAAHHQIISGFPNPSHSPSLTYTQVILSLATLQSAVSDLSRAYINHANTVLNRGPSNIDLGGITANLLENGILSGQQHGAAPAPALAAGDGKRKRARRYHDPNAPKRALTPFFLYMHHNRQAIAKELGDTAKAKDVSEEGTRRWQTMADSEKQVCCSYIYMPLFSLLTKNTDLEKYLCG